MAKRMAEKNGLSVLHKQLEYRKRSTTIGKIVEETCEALHQTMKKDFLKTPTSEEEWRKIAHEFELKWQFPHCIGAIDGKHIFIQPPANSGSMYYNYKSRFSILLMAIADANYKLIYTNVGVQGRILDADEAYPLRNDLMKPYPHR